MKKISISTLMSLVLILVIATAAFAATTGLPGTGWWAGSTIQNVGDGDAVVNILAYDSQSASTFPLNNIPLSVGNSVVINPWDLSLPAGFQGSAVVSASRKVQAVVNITNRYLSGQGVGDPATVSAAAGLYQGEAAPGPTLNFPLAKNNHYGKSTSFAIQNAGNNNAAIVATFKLPSSSGGPIVNYTYTSPVIAPGQMVIISPSDARDGSNNPPASGNGIFGGLTVTSSPVQNLAGSSLEYNTGEINATVLQATRGFTPNDYDDTWYAPTIKQGWFNRFTGLLVQNVSAGPVNVAVTYYGSDGACANQTYNANVVGLASGVTQFFNNIAAGMPSNCLASAKIVSTGGNIVAIVNEAFVSGVTNAVGKQEATSYNAIADKFKTTIVSIPLYKEDSYSKQTGVVIQNVGAAIANNVVITFKGPTGTYVSQPMSIAANKNIVIINARFWAASAWNGAGFTPTTLGCVATTTGCGSNGLFGLIITADQPIVAQANESTYPISAPRIYQDKNNFEGFNLSAIPGP